MLFRSWSNSHTSSSVLSLPAGSYTVTVTDANGCTISGSVIINGTSSPTVTVSTGVTILSGDSTTIYASGGISYQWSPATGLSCTTCANTIAAPLDTTIYYVTVTDINGCTAIDSVVVNILIQCNDFFVPTAFSPNGDNENDLYCLYGINCVKSLSFAIYNRWGEKIFNSTNPTKCRGGTSELNAKNKALDAGVFYYTLNWETTNGETFSKKGTITLIK